MLLPLLFQHAPLGAMGLLSYMNPHSTTQWKEAFRFLWCFLSETLKGTPLPAGFCGEGASSVVEMDWKHHMPVAEGRWHLCSGRSPGRGGEKSSSYQDKWAHLGKILFYGPYCHWIGEMIVCLLSILSFPLLPKGSPFQLQYTRQTPLQLELSSHH